MEPLIRHFLPYQIAWIRSGARIAIGEKSRRIGWTYASAYRAVQQSLGLQRAILVQPTGYGFDNRCLFDGLAQLGSDVARGIVVLKPDVCADQLRQMHNQGVRGVRGCISCWVARGRKP